MTLANDAAKQPEMVEFPDGNRAWYLNDQLHREDGPAVEFADGEREWYIRGQRHRLDGPAIEFADGEREWWIRGQRLTEQEFTAQTIFTAAEARRLSRSAHPPSPDVAAVYLMIRAAAEQGQSHVYIDKGFWVDEARKESRVWHEAYALLKADGFSVDICSNDPDGLSPIIEIRW